MRMHLVLVLVCAEAVSDVELLAQVQLEQQSHEVRAAVPLRG